MKSFSLGIVTATPRALQALADAEQTPGAFLVRHLSGDWGEMSREDARSNNRSTYDGSRVFSAYKLSSGVKIWIITEAENDDGYKASTCILLPSEY